MLRRVIGGFGATVLGLALVACSEDEPASTPSGHEHGDGDVMISLPVGDGTSASEVGYRIADVKVSKKAGQPGIVSFRILDFRGRPVTAYLQEQTRDLHLYVARTDLSIFRHLHPTIDDDGRWSARVTLPEAGDYRVMAEFIAEDDGGNGDHVIIGDAATVSGEWTPQPVADEPLGSDGVVEASVEGDLRVGPNQRLTVEVRDAEERPVKLGTYLGTYAHITAFLKDSGSLIHLHPLGEQVEKDATRLEVHTEFIEPGDYVFYIQVRVDGFLHTLRATATVQ